MKYMMFVVADPDAAAEADALACRFDQRLVDAERSRGNRFKVKVRILAAR